MALRVLLASVAFLVLAGYGWAPRSRPDAPQDVTAVQAPRPSNAQGRYDVELTDVACVAPASCAATGYLSAQTVSRGLLFVEKDGRWSVSEPPLPGILRQGRRSEGMSSVSCPAAGRCVAVGYAASGRQLEPLVFTQRTRGWEETVAPLPAGAKGGSLDLVSCPSTGRCTAAGTYVDSTGNDRGLLLDESNAGWGPPVTAGVPANGSATAIGATPAIEGMSCWAPANCAAVGLYGDTSGSPHGWLLTETDGAWAQGVESRLPANASTREGDYLYPVIELGPVSCAPTGDCTAVGGYGDRRSNQFGMILSAHAGQWGPGKRVPLPADAGPNPQQGNAPVSPMGSVACPSAGECSAVGWYLDNEGNHHGLLLRERAGTWNRSELVFPSGARAAPAISLDSVACHSAGNCLAVGAYDATSGLRPLLVAERNGRWIKSTEPPPPEGVGTDYVASLSSVSCPSARTCVAVGFTQTAGFANRRGLIVTIRG